MQVDASSQSCPDFEDLSCFSDGELSPAQVPRVAEHVAVCERCAGLLQHLTQGFGSSAPARERGAAGSDCADEERLILYLMRDLSAPDRAVVEQHLGHCDPCVYGLSLLHRRLRVQDFVDRPVPAQLQERVRTIIELEARPQVARAGNRPAAATWQSRVREAVDNFLRLPVLLPAAVAAGALLAIGLQEGRLPQPGAQSGIRAVDVTRDLRVTAGRAEVRERASEHSAVVASVERGQLLRVAGEERDWYRVELDEGDTGWVAKEAFE